MADQSTKNKRWLSWSLILALGLSVAACSSPEERAQAHYQSGKELLQSGEFIKAGLEFRNALKYNDKLADAWFGLASVEAKKCQLAPRRRQPAARRRAGQQKRRRPHQASKAAIGIQSARPGPQEC